MQNISPRRLLLCLLAASALFWGCAEPDPPTPDAAPAETPEATEATETTKAPEATIYLTGLVGLIPICDEPNPGPDCSPTSVLAVAPHREHHLLRICSEDLVECESLEISFDEPARVEYLRGGTEPADPPECARPCLGDIGEFSHPMSAFGAGKVHPERLALGPGQLDALLEIPFGRFEVRSKSCREYGYDNAESAELEPRLLSDEVGVVIRLASEEDRVRIVSTGEKSGGTILLGAEGAPGAPADASAVWLANGLTKAASDEILKQKTIGHFDAFLDLALSPGEASSAIPVPTLTECPNFKECPRIACRPGEDDDDRSDGTVRCPTALFEPLARQDCALCAESSSNYGP